MILSRDRPNESISLGMAGGLSVPRPIPREAMRRDGERAGLDGDALDDFIEALTLLDDFYVETEVKRAADDAAKRANKKK